MYDIRHYLDLGGADLFIDWLHRLRDPVAKTQIIKRVNRLELGNFGDHKFCRDGRVYYAQAGAAVILLLCGGDKRSQQSDISRAVKNWKAWQERTDDER